MAELLLRGGTVWDGGAGRRADVAVADGRITAVEPDLDEAPRELDVRGLDVLPAAVDPHVHFDEPGRTHWEGIAHGSAALAAGGGATWVDMPLNSTPVLDAPSFHAKRAAAEAASVGDFALWAGLTPGSLPHLPELAALGAVGFKAFLCDSGLPEFPRADDATLLEGMRRAADAGVLVAVHAENEALTRAGTEAARAAGGTGMAAAAAARPLVAELEAVSRTLLLAEEAGCRVHLVHLSHPRSVALVRAARERGVDASCETCPHYLAFDAADAESAGSELKCAPPLRAAPAREGLWRALADGDLDWVASDHSPCPPSMKAGREPLDAWGGVSGVQSTLALVLTGAADGRLPRGRVASVTAAAAAARLRLAGKGRLRPGFDADLTVVARDEPWTLAASALRTRHRRSPFVGRAFRGRVRHVLVRGRPVFDGTHVRPHGAPRLLRPADPLEVP